MEAVYFEIRYRPKKRRGIEIIGMGRDIHENMQ